MNRLPLLVAISILALAAPGCQWSRETYESLKGEGFPEWNQQLNTSSRGKADDAKPSGFFTDRRSEQIERNLGGGF
ncbi:MAG: hypothetical protein SFU86_17645 [Pirellulaceae bacterium]|nr:hypothetical protein [Pirellulaceae bacterium]